ncbi:MAG: ankyrin repeat domain-containing protein [Oligoflexia bacterium]|nr:ankyrin repeat domain-containing protein [Oligoflexia bacterium]
MDQIKKIFEYCLKEDIKGLCELIAQDVDLNVVNDEGLDPLTFSIINKKEKIAELLISCGVNTNFSSSSKTTPLIQSSIVGSLHTAKLLLYSDADINAVDNSGKNALMYAIMNNNFQMGQCLLENNIDCNRADNYGFTPLNYAVIFGDELIVKMLIERKVNLEFKNKEQTALHMAIESGNINIAKMLLAAGAVMPPGLVMPLDIQKDVEMPVKLKPADKKKININTIDDLSISSEMEILEKSLAEEVDYVNSSRGDDSGDKSFEVMDFADNLDMIKLSKKKFENGSNILMQLAIRGSFNLVERFAKYIDVNAKDFNGYTALTYASIHGHVDIVQFLLKCGAKVEDRKSNAISPLAWSVMNGHVEIAQKLIEAGANHKFRVKGTPILILAVISKSVKMVEAILDAANEPIAGFDHKGITAIEYAKHKKLTAIVELLAKNKHKIRAH